jgi:hypothetical protein
MRPTTAHPNRWLRYPAAVAAFFWALGVAAGCHLPHAMAPGMSSAPTTIGHEVAAFTRHSPLGTNPCSPMEQGCKHVAHACSTTDAVVLAVVVAVVIVAGSLTWPVASVPRGPPQSDDLVPHRSGRDILTRHCIARI